MKPKDFVYNQAFRGAMAKGAAEKFAHEKAVQGTQNYLKSAFVGKAGNYIEQQIKEAVRLSKMAKAKR
jgi:hypothetical protein